MTNLLDADFGSEAEDGKFNPVVTVNTDPKYVVPSSDQY
jgi:hypothetical protein